MTKEEEPGFFIVSSKSQFRSTYKWSISLVIYDTLTYLGVLREKKHRSYKESATEQILLLNYENKD